MCAHMHTCIHTPIHTPHPQSALFLMAIMLDLNTKYPCPMKVLCRNSQLVALESRCSDQLARQLRLQQADGFAEL